MLKGLCKISLLVTLLLCSIIGVVASEVELSEVEAKRQARGLVMMDYNVVPKGQWIVGATASYSRHLNDNYNWYIINNIISEGYNIKAAPVVAYAIRNNLTIGARLEYSRSLLRVDNASLSLGDDFVNLTVADIYSISQAFQGEFGVRQYIPLGSNMRFALFAEVCLGVGGSHSKYAFDSPVQGTYATSVDVSLSVVPGFVAFATNNIAFEVSIGALGLSYSHIDQIQNQVYTGSVNNSSMSFLLNIFTVGLGVSLYL